MGCQRKISCLLIVFLVGVFWWMSDNRPAMGNEPNQSRPEQNDISHWIAELESSLPSSGNNTGPDETKDVTPSKVGETYGDNPAAKLVSDDAKDKISVDLFKVDLHNVFRLLGQVSGKNIVVDESVKGSITLALENVPWTFVLDVIKNLKGLDSIERNNTIMIYPADKSLEWGGDTATGTLDVQIEPLLIEKEQELIIDKDGIPIEGKQQGGIQIERIVDIQTPIEEVAKAQDLINKAAKFEKQGAIGQALKFYIEASDIWPENVSLAKKISALALGPGGQELTAFNFARKALRFAPKDSEATTFAAVALARMGKKDEAKIYFERAMGTASIPSMHTLHNYAVFCESEGEYRQALRLLNNIEVNYELSADAMLLRARVYEHLGQIDKAITEYRAVLQGGAAIPLRSQRYAKERMEILMTDELSD